MNGPVEVARYRYRHEAEMRRALLDDEGIDSVVVGDDVGGMYPGIFPTGSIRLVVGPEDAERARTIVTEFDQGEYEIDESEGEPPADP
ncbi:MAG TPA: DUF2007 domain-containing protein [Gemmatimonadota bacterium]|nr:DUF2007 domain-containing protein [Gemmatimonadota bacterium]